MQKCKWCGKSLMRTYARAALSIVVLLFAAPAYGQWLPDDAQAREAALWKATGVELPAGLKFYRLPKMSQHLSIISDTHVNYPTSAVGQPVFDKLIWSAPGGLAWSDRSEWRNATAALFPTEIICYRTMTRVKNPSGYRQLNAVCRWVFPIGTVFADLQVRKHGGEEWPFELRLREKGTDGEWHAKVYRPWGDEADLPAGTKRVKWQVPALDEKIAAKEYEAFIIPDGVRPGDRFKESRLAFVSEGSDGFAPRRYSGNVVSCTACHDRAGESGNYSGSNAPGADGVISWHPFAADGKWDRRWPLEIDKRFYGPDVDDSGRRIPGLREDRP